MAQFRKKPVVIEAWKAKDLLTARLGQRVPDCIDQAARNDKLKWLHDGISIFTLEGTMLAGWDDWVIRGVKGELYPSASPMCSKRRTKPWIELYCLSRATPTYSFALGNAFDDTQVALTEQPQSTRRIRKEKNRGRPWQRGKGGGNVGYPALPPLEYRGVA